MAFKGSEHIAAKVYIDNMSTVIQQIKEFDYLERSALCIDNNSMYIYTAFAHVICSLFFYFGR